MTQPTVSATPNARLMDVQESIVRESRLRQCPSCQAKKVVHAGHVISEGGKIKTQHRCEECGTGFWFVRERPY
jgi:hypothetical protein